MKIENDSIHISTCKINSYAQPSYCCCMQSCLIEYENEVQILRKMHFSTISFAVHYVPFLSSEYILFLFFSFFFSAYCIFIGVK